MTTDPSHQPAPVLRVEALRKTFSLSRGLFSDRLDVHAVNDISLQIEAGETLGIVGESGCGKSTLSRMLAGVIAPTDGRFELKGQEMSTLPFARRQKAMREVQMVFQSPFASLNPRMRAVQMVREPLDIHRRDLSKPERERMSYAMLAEVGINAELAERYPHQLSGGQQQRVGIARALVGGVSLVICDEPVSALDVSVQAQVINLLRKLQKERGVSYLFVSHDLAVVGAMSHRIAVMYLGRIVEQGLAADILARPQHPYTQSLVESANIADPVIERSREPRILVGDLPKPTDPDIGCRFATRCWKATALCRKTRPDLLRAKTGIHEVACHFPIGAET